MKKVFVIAVVLVSAFAGCASKVEQQQVPPTGGRLEASNPTFDNKDTVRGEVIKHVFELKNTGDAPIRITDTKAGCSCTVAVVSNDVIPPGGTGSIEVSFNTNGRKGRQSKTVKVFTDSTLTPSVDLTVAGDIKPALAFSVESIQFGQVPKGTEVKRELDVVGMKADGVSITGLTVTPAEDTRFSATVVEGSGGRKVAIVFKSEGVKGFYRGRLEATTDSTEYPMFFANVVAEVTGDIVAEPRTVVFPPRGRLTEAEKTTQEARVVLRSLTGKPFSVRSLDAGELPVKLVSATPGVEGSVELTLEGPLDSTLKEGRLVFQIKGGEPLEMNCVIGRASRSTKPIFPRERQGVPARLKDESRALPPATNDEILRSHKLFELQKRHVEGAGN